MRHGRALFSALWVVVILTVAPCWAQTVAITEPRPYTVFQRATPTQGDIQVRGTYTGAPTAIEARFNTATTAGLWQKVDATPSGQQFDGTLTDQPVGEGTLQVRHSDRPSIVDSRTKIGVGDVFAITGQSNAAGQGVVTNRFDPNHILSTFASVFDQETRAWRIADDPFGELGSGGSPWPLLAESIVSAQGIPIGFVPVTGSGVSIVSWKKAPSDEAANGAMWDALISNIDQATTGTRRIKAVLWFQGERDMKEDHSPEDPSLEGDYDAYKTELTSFVNNIVVATNAEVVVVGQSNFNLVGDAPLGLIGIDRIREAQRDAWDDHPRAVPGPVTHDFKLDGPGGDMVHFKSAAHIQEFARRWWAALNHHCYGGPGDGVGPRFSSAALDPIGGLYVDVTYTDASLPVAPNSVSGFFVTNAGFQGGPLDGTVISADTIRIQLPAPIGTPSNPTVSSCRNKTSWGRSLPRDTGPDSLIAVPFYDEPIQ